MSSNPWLRFLNANSRRTPSRTTVRGRSGRGKSPRQAKLILEPLEDRLAPTINVIGSAGYFAQVQGDSSANTITVSRAAGNPNTVVVQEGSQQSSFPITSSNFTVYVYGGAGNDNINVDETNGSFAGYYQSGTN